MVPRTVFVIYIYNEAERETRVIIQQQRHLVSEIVKGLFIFDLRDSLHNYLLIFPYLEA